MAIQQVTAKDFVSLPGTGQNPTYLKKLGLSDGAGVDEYNAAIVAHDAQFGAGSFRSANAAATDLNNQIKGLYDFNKGKYLPGGVEKAATLLPEQAGYLARTVSPNDPAGQAELTKINAGGVNTGANGAAVYADTQPSSGVRYNDAPNIPPGWDAQTYANFKAANPNLEPNAQDTAAMKSVPPNQYNNPTSPRSAPYGSTPQSPFYAPNTPAGKLYEKTHKDGVYTPYNPQDEINALNASANADMQKELGVIQKEVGGKVDISKSADLMAKLTASLSAEQENPAPKKTLVQTYNEQRAALGVGDLEGSLASADADIAKLDASWKALHDTEDNRVVSTSIIRRRQSAEEIQYNQQRAELVAARNTAATRLDQKYGVLNTIVTLTGKDMENAQQDYQRKFDNTIKLQTLLSNQEDKQQTQAEKLRDDARANLTVMTDALKSGNANWDTLSPSTKADIKKLEIQAGYPPGFTQFVHANVDNAKAFLTPIEQADGTVIIPVVTTNPDGTPGLNYINTGIKKKVTGSGGGGGGATATAKANKQKIAAALDSATGPDGYVSPVDYAAAKRDWVNQGLGTSKLFDETFSIYRNPALSDEKNNTPIGGKDWLGSPVTGNPGDFGSYYNVD